MRVSDTHRSIDARSLLLVACSTLARRPLWLRRCRSQSHLPPQRPQPRQSACMHMPHAQSCCIWLTARHGFMAFGPLAAIGGYWALPARGRSLTHRTIESIAIRLVARAAGVALGLGYKPSGQAMRASRSHRSSSFWKEAEERRNTVSGYHTWRRRSVQEIRSPRSQCERSARPRLPLLKLLGACRPIGR
jgi:hypothetical protein